VEAQSTTHSVIFFKSIIYYFFTKNQWADSTSIRHYFFDKNRYVWLGFPKIANNTSYAATNLGTISDHWNFPTTSPNNISRCLLWVPSHSSITRRMCHMIVVSVVLKTASWSKRVLTSRRQADGPFNERHSLFKKKKKIVIYIFE